MLSIFVEFIDHGVEVFIDDFSIFGSSFDSCLYILSHALKRSEETSLVLNWEKCHFRVMKGIVLGRRVSSWRLEVDKAKIVIIENLPTPIFVKDVHSSIRYAGFY